jgi:hypothetical protein
MKFKIQKTVLLSILTLLTSTAQIAAAQTYKIQKSDLSLYAVSVQNIRLVEKQSTCQDNFNCPILSSTVARINVNLKGCLDRVAAVSHNLIVNSAGQPVLSVAVLAAENRKSSSVKCVVQPSETLEINLGTQVLNFELLQLNDLNANSKI